jgi:hypothetical protein
MGLSKLVPRRDTPPLAELLEQLARAGLPSLILMVDNQLVSPKVPPPSAWRDLRLKTPAGTVSLKRDAAGISVTVFGNADEALLAAQEIIAKALDRS